jgi:hypothetical protein
MAIPRSTQRSAVWLAATRMLGESVSTKPKKKDKDCEMLTYWQRPMNELEVKLSLSEWGLVRTHDAPSRSESQQNCVHGKNDGGQKLGFCIDRFEVYLLATRTRNHSTKL